MATVQLLEQPAEATDRDDLNSLASVARADGVRVGLFNVKFSPNLGDGLLSECLEAELSTRLPGVTIQTLDLAGRTRYSQGRRSRASALAALHHSPQSVRHLLAETILGRKLRNDLRGRWRAALREIDAVVVGGGNLLSDSDLNFPLKLEAAMAETHAAGVPAAVFAVGVSDNWSPRGHALFTRALSESQLFYAAVRDDRSAEVWRRRLGSAGVIPPQVVNDPAVLAAIHFPRELRGDRTAPSIGLGVTHPIALSYHADELNGRARDLEGWLVALAGACLARGWNVAVFTNGSPEDENYLARLRPRLEALAPRGALVVARRFANPAAFARFVSSLDLLMAHRLHANIAAYAYEIPQIGFAWDVKLKSFLEHVGRQACLAKAGRDSVDAVAALAARQLEAGVDPSRRRAVVAEARANVAKLGEAVMNALPVDKRQSAQRRAWRATPSAAPRIPGRLVIVNDFSIARGGATALALLEAELFGRRNMPITFITGDAGGNPDFDSLGVSVVAVGQQRLLEAGVPSAALRGLYNRRALAALSDWIVRNDTPNTVYHLHVWSQVLSPSVFTALEPVRARTLITAHDFFLVCPNGAYANYASGTICSLKPLSAACLLTACDKRNHGHKLWRVARQGLQSRALRFADGRPMVLMIHEGMREPLERGGVPASALRTTPNPIRPWHSTRVAAELNREFVFVGRLGEEKGPDLAARAARRAGVPLVIIGDGPMRASLQEDFPEVAFTGQLAPAAVAERTRAARALVMPSRYPEPYGLVAVEAMWSGIPLVVAKSALLASEIDRRGAGLVCDPLDERKFAEALSLLAGDDALARRMSDRAFADTRDLGLTPEAWVEELERAFSDVLASSPAAPSTSQATLSLGSGSFVPLDRKSRDARI
jgi:glycosyltransferase involved in cell wall biosynthesis/polysaccharide pyruvyl transferase WcaK-like protein